MQPSDHTEFAGSLSSEVVSTGRRLARNTAVNGGAAAVNTVIALVSTALLLNGWGSSKYGLWMFLLMMTFDRGFMALLDLGHGTAALQLLASEDKVRQVHVLQKLRSRYLLFSCFGIFFLLSVGRFLIGKVVDVEASENLWTLTILMSSRLPIDMWHSTNLLYLESQSRYPTMRMIDVFSNLLWLLMLSIVVGTEVSMVFVAALYLLLGFLQLAVSSLLLREYRQQASKCEDASGRRDLDLWANGRWVALQRMLSIVYSNMDRVIISLAVGLSGLGRYEVPYKIQAFGVLLLSILPSAVFPLAARLKSNNELKQLSALFVRASRLTVAACIPPLLAVVMLSESLVINWVGVEYRDLANSVRLFVSWTFLGVFHVIGATMLSAIGRNKEIFMIFLVSIAVNLPASIALGFRFGVNGVITGTLLGYVVSFVPYLVVELREFKVSVTRWLREVLAPILVPITLEYVVLFVGLRQFSEEMGLLWVITVGGFSTIVAWTSFAWFFARKEDLVLIRSVLRLT